MLIERVCVTARGTKQKPSTPLADPPYASHEDYQTEVPGVRRRGLALMIAMTGLALLGTAGAVGYRLGYHHAPADHHSEQRTE